MGRLPVEQNHHHHHHHQDHGRGHQPFSVFFGPGLSSHTSHSQSRWRWTVVRCCHCTGGGRGEGGGSLPACSNIARLHVEKKAHNTTGGTKMPRFTIQPWSFQDLLLLLRRRRRQVLPSIKAGCSVPILAFSSGARPVGGAVLLLSPPPSPPPFPFGLGQFGFHLDKLKVVLAGSAPSSRDIWCAANRGCSRAANCPGGGFCHACGAATAMIALEMQAARALPPGRSLSSPDRSLASMGFPPPTPLFPTEKERRELLR